MPGTPGRRAASRSPRPSPRTPSPAGSSSIARFSSSIAPSRFFVERLEAREVVVALPFAVVLGDELREVLAGRRLVAVPVVAEGDEDLLPLGDLVRDARLRADREHGRVRLGCDGPALRARLRVDERPGRGVDLVVAEDERRSAAGDEVELLVAVLLGVLLDDALVALLGRVRVRAEGGDPEAAPHRAPEEALVVDREAVELVEVRDFVRLFAQVRLLNVSRTTGSICSMPSTRSSRFSFHVQRVKVSSRLPS